MGGKAVTARYLAGNGFVEKFRGGHQAGDAGDIWSDRGVSLLGLCEYYMSATWTIEQLVLAATPFSERHTGEAIDEKTRTACVAAGLSNDVGAGHGAAGRDKEAQGEPHHAARHQDQEGGRHADHARARRARAVSRRP